MASAARLGDGHHRVDARAGQHLPRPRRPLNDDAVDPLARSETEMQPAIVLTRESRSAVDNTSLAQITRLHEHLGADRAAIAARADELEANPVVRAVGIRAI